VSRADPKQRFLGTLARELRWHPLARRRLMVELAAHMDDSAAGLRANGWPADEAAAEAARRLGNPETVAGIFQSTRPSCLWTMPARRLRSPAWIAVGVVSLVTAWAAELPQASGAKATTSTVHVRLGIRHGSREPGGSVLLRKGQR
jgi:hypothetical protein